MGWRQKVILTGFGLLGATQLHRLVAPVTRGVGAILTFHRVQPHRSDAFAPNNLLSITPSFLDQSIRRLRELRYAIVSMDEALDRLSDRTRNAGRFAVLSFDDGFRDNLEYAVPVLERHGAPAIFYLTTGYADRTARLWWIELEEVVRRADRIEVQIGGERMVFDAGSTEAKRSAFAAIYWHLRHGPEERLLAVIGDLCRHHGVDSKALVDRLCLDWSEIATLAHHPLATVGAHTVSHPMLAKHDEAMVLAEMVDSKAILEQRLGQPVRHFSYPVGDPTSAGRREFRLAGEAGFASAVTTRPGLLFPPHRDRLLALPRMSANGNHQTLRELDVLLSGAAFALWNRGRRVAPI